MKEEKERKELNESVLAKEKEEARWKAYREGSIERATLEGYTEGKTLQGKGKGIFGKLSDIGAAANRGLDFLNQDSIFETPRSSQSHHAKTGREKSKDVTIHIDVSQKRKKTKQKKKKPQTNIFDLPEISI